MNDCEKESSVRILLVDDDEAIRKVISYHFRKEGYQVKTLSDGRDCLSLAKEWQPHIILLDILMPHQDGVETCLQLRRCPNLDQTHILMLTGCLEEFSEVASFQAGADQYIHKPLRIKPLMFRVKALLERNIIKKGLPPLVIDQDLVINAAKYEVFFKKEKIKLPKKEFELLYFLAQHAGQAFDRDALLKQIWGADVIVSERTVDVHIRKIRSKIGEERIKTIKGLGYRFI